MRYAIRNLPIAVSAGIAMVGVLVGVGIAAIPGPTGLITGCVGPSGHLRVIDPAADSCHQNESTLTWRQVGVTGPTGPTGADGVTGPTGPTGADGFVELSSCSSLVAGITTASTTYAPAPGGPGGPGQSCRINVTQPMRGLVFLTATCANSVNDGGWFMGFAVSGATTIAVSDSRSVGRADGAAGAAQASSAVYWAHFNVGLHDFTAMYKVATGGTVTCPVSNITVLWMS